MLMFLQYYARILFAKLNDSHYLLIFRRIFGKYMYFEF